MASLRGAVTHSGSAGDGEGTRIRSMPRP
jgi:hypothetical protein